ncbi:transmembrane protein, putative (macronuclear) [Tetrahymena thermophila SB210]|uniref:Transmembrane protein, putative n=1 Tax=Tetrahymena thermophila (strain SB210) TaxID=312017 RepID=W7XA23_TETTS|nr:transmembrane protein, putative [Tetrahymena thermophila SB210]EWS73253.1 transmembrane protein, putative [Tetrahymena thermophila SB210]|eukprot:XP_012654217.1 transmembrane protein, putative [Tetrahymena thermophila SB210]
MLLSTFIKQNDNEIIQFKIQNIHLLIFFFTFILFLRKNLKFLRFILNLIQKLIFIQTNQQDYYKLMLNMYDIFALLKTKNKYHHFQHFIFYQNFKFQQYFIKSFPYKQVVQFQRRLQKLHQFRNRKWIEFI